ncbi:hypothetical protein VNO78_32844 [Psophocarpus tetragonolobus]|uniref:Uncharacterized protein n=1 Tax=Psophocarpus tetragonolobus TaxID=3891 RepID=A0AAN9NW78_PSOTE
MWSFSRKGASGFSSSSTAEEVTHGIDGTGLTAIVTGNLVRLGFNRLCRDRDGGFIFSFYGKIELVEIFVAKVMALLQN